MYDLFQTGHSMEEMEAIPLNKGQQIAKVQELAEDKIAFQANADKQAYASNQRQEKLSEAPKDDQDKQ